jgi:hypothetical protein
MRGTYLFIRSEQWHEEHVRWKQVAKSKLVDDNDVY